MTDTEPRVWPFFTVVAAGLALLALSIWAISHQHHPMAAATFLGWIASVYVADRLNDDGDEGGEGE